MSKNKNFYILGISITVITVLLIGIAPGTIYFYLLPVIFLIIGLIIIWISGTAVKKKIFWTIFPIFTIPSLLFIWRQINTVPPEEFLIPENFKGRVSIIYELNCAPEIKKIDGKIIYKIPNGGILLISNKLKSGFINQKYYFVNKNGNKTEIPKMDTRDFNEEWTLEKNPKEPSRKIVGVFGWGSLGNYAESVSSKKYNYQEFFIGSYNDLKFEDFKESLHFDSLKIQKAKDCEKKYGR